MWQPHFCLFYGWASIIIYIIRRLICKIRNSGHGCCFILLLSVVFLFFPELSAEAGRSVLKKDFAVIWNISAGAQEKSS